MYHGLPQDLYTFREQPGEYLAFVGRISPEKRVDRAIEIAIKAGMPLKIAAKVDDADRDYYEQNIKHLLDHPLIEFIGEIGEAEKNEFNGNAFAFLFPIDWPEPFGLSMVEATACGTPVIAFPCGSVPEIIEDGANGFMVNSIDEAVAALEKVPTLDRKRVREIFDERFSAPRMTRDYVEIYKQLVLDSGTAARVEDFGLPRWRGFPGRKGTGLCRHGFAVATERPRRADRLAPYLPNASNAHSPGPTGPGLLCVFHARVVGQHIDLPFTIRLPACSPRLTIIVTG